MQLFTAILCAVSLLAVAGAAKNEDEYTEMHEMLDELKEIVKDMKKVNDKSTPYNEDNEDSVDSVLEFTTDVTKEGSMCACKCLYMYIQSHFCRIVTVFLIFIGCIQSFKVEAVTGTRRYSNQSPRHGTNPRLAIKVSGTIYSAAITGDKNYGQNVYRTISRSSFSPSLPCISRSSITNAYLQSIYGGRDGWFVKSIKTYFSTGVSYKLMSSNTNFNKWVDYDQRSSYPYNARLVPLTLTAHSSSCLTDFTIDAFTGNLRYAGFSSSYMGNRKHKIKLYLKDNSQLQGDICSPAYRNRPFTCHLTFSRGFNAGSKCIKKSDIKLVTIVAGGNDGWYTTSITTEVKTATGFYEVLTEDKPFNKWLDGNQAYLYKYDATKHVLSLGSEDTPLCGFENPICTCKESASTCIFNLEIDEIQTFTSYQKLRHDDRSSMYIRGTQGVSYFIKDGVEKSHKAYNGRSCSKQTFNETRCTYPQYVDGKTFREAIGVNGQIPGPTIIVHDQQMVVIHVRNNLTLEGVSIHWHGMHQRGTPWMDGVGQVSHCQIGPASTFSYIYKASPSGTFWYHSHSGAQRTDGFFGALIVKETSADLQRATNALNLGKFEDKPGEHSISLLDWESEPGYGRLIAGLGYYEETLPGQVPDDDHERYESTRSYESGEIGPVPFYSGLINGKGRHKDVDYAETRLSVFTVESGKKYRFRLIGAQGLYAYKFSIDGHKLTVVATDGYWTKPEKEVDYIIIHTGERFDFILNANQRIKEYWMRAETLEINRTSRSSPPYKSLGHVAEGILQYVRRGETNVPNIPSTRYQSIKDNSPPIVCTRNRPCRAINCPFKDFHTSYHTRCTNIAEMRLLLPAPSNEMPNAYPCRNKNCRHFINFNFEGDAQSSAVNGRNFVLPPVPPQTQYDDFIEQATHCSLEASCNPQSTSCLCTHRLDLPHGETVQIVLSAVGQWDNAHPIHVHGHTFHVLKVGYPEYDSTTGFIKKKNGDSVHNSDIKCGDSTCTNGCNKKRCTQPGWSTTNGPTLSIDRYTIRKDTVMLPAGGYVVINFLSDNPGFWFLHCHIEVHQLEGMALILNEAYPKHMTQLKPPASMNKCGDFHMTVGDYEEYTKKFQGSISAYQQNATKFLFAPEEDTSDFHDSIEIDDINEEEMDALSNELRENP